MGDPAMYPEVRSARNIYALQRLPRDFTDDVMARKQWVDNNLVDRLPRRDGLDDSPLVLPHVERTTEDFKIRVTVANLSE
eukprot:scaffold20395_cov128-Isochrysis_galbana.AAC.7